MEISGWGILKTVISLYDVAHGILKHASQHPHIDIHVLVRNITIHWYITCIGVTWQPQTGVTAFQFWNVTYMTVSQFQRILVMAVECDHDDGSKLAHVGF